MSCECVISETYRSGALPKEQKKRSISYQAILFIKSFNALQFPMCFNPIFKFSLSHFSIVSIYMKNTKAIEDPHTL